MFLDFGNLPCATEFIYMWSDSFVCTLGKVQSQCEAGVHLVLSSVCSVRTVFYMDNAPILEWFLVLADLIWGLYSAVAALSLH